MKVLENLKTAYKLILVIGACLTLALTIGLLAIVKMGGMNAQAQMLGSTIVPSVVQLNHVTSDIKQYRLWEFQHLLASTPSAKAVMESNMAKTDDDLNSWIKQYSTDFLNAQDKKNTQHLLEDWNGYLSGHSQFIKESRANQLQAGVHYLTGPAFLHFKKIRADLQTMIKLNQKVGSETGKDAQSSFYTARFSIITLLVASMIIGLLAAAWLTVYLTGIVKKVSNSLNSVNSLVADLGSSVQALSEGDLTSIISAEVSPISITSKDEFGMMAGTLNEMITQIQTTALEFEKAQGNLKVLIGSVAQDAQSIASVSVQLAANSEQAAQASNDIAGTIQQVATATNQAAIASQEIAAGSEQQSRAAMEAATTMEQLKASTDKVQQSGLRQLKAAELADTGMKQTTQSVEEVVRSAQEMAANAMDAAAVAQTGGKAVEQTITSMGRIKNQVLVSSEKVKELGQRGQEIGAIVETIAQIAEQTNLLALNAAIEAARAGEHGKGFAVVADEVRKLAERAGSATKEISSLIGNVRTGVDEAVSAMQSSNKEVSEGSERSEEAGAALTQILQAVQSVAAQVQEVTATATEMSTSVKSVSSSIETVKEAADENKVSVAEMLKGSTEVATLITTVARISEGSAAGAEEMSATVEEVAASAQNVSASVEEQTASISEVNLAVGELKSMALRLQEMVQQFKLDNNETVKPTTLRTVNGGKKSKAA